MISHDPTHFSKSLNRFFAHLGAPPVSVISKLETDWHEVAGPGLAENSKPYKIIDQTLYVSCSGPVWVSQVRWSEQQIIESFNNIFHPSEIKAVVAKVDKK